MTGVQTCALPILLRSNFEKYQSTIISEIYSFEKKIRSNIIKKRVRELFRSAVGEYIFESPITKRAFEKPRGYPGDYLIFEMFYNDSYAPEGTGYFLDKWILDHPLPKGAIYRKNKLKEMLSQIIEGNKNKLKILNIGCGPSRDLRELISENMDMGNVYITCLDQDDEALKFSEDEVNKIQRHNNISFIKHDIISICLNRKTKQLDKQNVIYSLGVADYFMKTTLENFIRYCFDLLEPKGKLIIPLCSSHEPELYIPLRWFCEWDFYSHDANEIRDFVEKEIGIEKVKVIWEKSQPIFFVIIEK